MTVETNWRGSAAASWLQSAAADRLRQLLAGERERWILWLPVALGIGAAAYFSLAGEPPRWLGALLVGAGLVATAVTLRDVRALVAAIGLSAMAVGFAAAQWRAHNVAAPVLAKTVHHRTVTGHVVSVEPRGARYRITVAVSAIDRLAPAATPARVRISAAAHQYGNVRPGTRVSVRATLRPPPAPSLPGGFDFRRVAWFQRLGGVGFATGAVAAAQEPGLRRGGVMAALSDGVQTLRRDIAEDITATLPGTSGAVAAALMVGERGAIPDDVRAAMQQSGLAHLLAISGLHVGLLAGFVFFAIRVAFAAWPRVALRYPVKKWAAAAAISMSAVYLALAGATVPTQRAFIMTGLVLLAVILDRRGISMRLVAWAATVILLLRPEAVLSVSFQMSFAAVIALVAVYEVTGDRFRRALGDSRIGRRFAVYLASVLLTTLVASLATAPFAVFHFNQFAAYSVAANLIAIPIAAFWVMPLIVVSFVLMPLGLEGIAVPALGIGIDLIVGVAMWVSSWPGASLNVAAPPLYGLTLAVAGGLWLCLWQTRWRLFGVLPIVAGALSAATVATPNILVSADGKLAGVLGGDGVLLVSDGRGQAFARDQWLRRSGAPDWRAFPRPGEGRVAGMRCDAIGCVLRQGGRTIAFVGHADALPEDCRAADILIARFTVPRGCSGPTVVIDGRALRRYGSHAVSWAPAAGPAALVVKTAEGASARRLWRGGWLTQ